MTSQPASRPVRTRFAPSPSGHLHVGGARTALFNWAFARHHSGSFVLRIEDTDQKRSSEAAGMAFLEDLAWLGIEWDEGPEFEYEGRRLGGGAAGPYFQSQRLANYAAEFDRLIASGHAYPAFETPEELAAARTAARAANQAYRYDRAALKLDPKTVQEYLREGRPHVIRFRVPDDREVVVHDDVLGDVRIPAGELDDFVIRKADGFPTYHFAVVCDDEAMGITHVLRAQEHLYNTPRHVLLQEALSFRIPVYGHMPLIFNPDNSKMSKRDKDKALRSVVKERGLSGSAVIAPAAWEAWLADKDRQLDFDSARALADELGVELPEIDVDDFRRAGYLPDVMVNYLALLGWSPGENIEKFGADFLVERFSLDRIGKSAAKFDREKLKAFNLDAIQALGADGFVAAFRAHCDRYHPQFVARLTGEQFDLVARASWERSRSLEEPMKTCRFFVLPDEAVEIEESKPVRKAMGGDAAGLLAALRDVLAACSDWNVSALETTINAFAEAQTEGKLGKVAQPLRVAVSGSTVSPPIYDTLVILGRESTLRRIDCCLQRLAVMAAKSES